MWQGIVLSINTAPDAGKPLVEVPEVLAVPDKGLEGDRYFFQQGSFSRWPGPHRAVSLIAIEDLDSIHEEHGITLTVKDSRRNILTQGVPLRQLIKQEFYVGSVRLKAERLCQPCKYLARMVEEPDLVAAMVNKGGIRARILNEGIIRKGDPVVPA